MPMPALDTPVEKRYNNTLRDDKAWSLSRVASCHRNYHIRVSYVNIMGMLAKSGKSSSLVRKMVWVLERKNALPVEQLQAAIERIGAGDLTTPVTCQFEHADDAALAQALEAARAQLAERFGALNARREAQARFLAGMSHEFRTPLAGMEASVELLQENLRTLSPEETQQLLSSVQLSLSMLHQLIDNLLESSKLETNHFVLSRRATDIERLIGEAIRLTEPMFARRQQRLALDVPLEVQAFQADPTRVIQMLVNLLSNASKYSPVGSLVEVIVGQQQEALSVRVADRGRGVSQEKHGSIFMPFIRLEPETQQEHGSGIGLSVVKAIAEAHHGQVGVEAREGGGSVFWVTIPLTENAG